MNIHPNSIPADVPVAYMDHHERARIRLAAFRVTRLYPGPAGEVLSRELLSWEGFGWRLNQGGSASGLIARLVEHIFEQGR